MKCLTLPVGLTLLLFPVWVWAQSTHSVFFQGSDYELNIYRIKGDKPGKMNRPGYSGDCFV